MVQFLDSLMNNIHYYRLPFVALNSILACGNFISVHGGQMTKAVNWTELVYNLVVPQHVTILTHMYLKPS